MGITNANLCHPKFPLFTFTMELETSRSMERFRGGNEVLSINPLLHLSSPGEQVALTRDNAHLGVVGSGGEYMWKSAS